VVAAIELFGKETLDPDEPLIEVAESLGMQLGRIFERQEGQIKLRENERMAAVGLTAAKIAHEIGNPLNGMYTTAQLLERECVQHLGQPLSQGICDTVGVLVKETERLRALLDELRSLSFRSSPKLRPRNVAELIMSLLKAQSQVFRDAGVRVRKQFSPDLPPVLVEPERFSQALLNLIKNAIEAMPDGGQLTLRAYRAEDRVVIEVADTGVGIPEDLPVLELFVTSKASGSGLGLPVVQQIIAAHNGTLDYWSMPGEGTTFRLVLPMANEQV
jgi:signal transduction histidine kinase